MTFITRLFIVFTLLIVSDSNIAKKNPILIKKLHIVLISPTSNDQGFWGDVHNFGRASAADLGIKFQILYNASHHGLTYVELIEDLLSSAKKPDAILAVSYQQKTRKILALSVKYNVPILLINNGLPKITRDEIGLPRTKYKTYLGHISANDYQLSKQLSLFLIKQAKMKHPKKMINIIGISGSRDATETHDRNLALRQVVEQDPMAKLYQIVYTDWAASTALRQSSGLLKRHKDIHVMWYASDYMALRGMTALDYRQQKQTVTGGFDWTAQGINSIHNGEFTASAGGHFTDAGFALVLLFDYFHGKDFADIHPLVSFSSGGLIHQGNVDEFYKLLTVKDWQSQSFKKYSRVYNPHIKSYDFSINSLLQTQPLKNKP